MSSTTTDQELEQDIELERDSGSERDPEILYRGYEADMHVGDGRTVDVRIVPYGEIIRHRDGHGGVPLGVEYQEEFLPGCFNHQLNAAHRVIANVEHQQGIAGMVGRGLMLREDRDGFRGEFRILKGEHGDKTLELINEGTFDCISIEARPVHARRSPTGVIQRTRANLRNIAFTRFGAYQGARVLAVRDEGAPAGAPVIIDAPEFAPDMDPDLLARCRALGVTLPQRYEETHLAQADTSPEGDTSDSDTRRANNDDTEE